jgi:ubiquinone/menaquinone biosynthesis C-methylase UbiE
MIMGEVRHEHSGHSSADVIDPSLALEMSGIRTGDKVLDLGCSVGDYSILAASIVGRGEIIALDFHRGSLDILSNKVKEHGLDNVRILEHDMTKGIPLPDGSIDRVLMFNVLHGLVFNGESKIVLEDIVRILYPKGTVAIIESRPGANGRGPPEEVRIGPDRIEGLMGEYGLSVLDHQRIGPFHDLFLIGNVK